MWKQFLIGILLCNLALTSAVALQREQIDNIVVFGDSLSDAGYANLVPRPTGKPARYTNGYVWAQYLSNSLLHKSLSANNLHPLIPVTQGGYADGTLNGYDYAAGGATTTGEGIIPWPGHYSPPALEQQITQYELQHHDNHGKINSRNLYIIWVGSNNLLRVFNHTQDSKFKFFLEIFSAANTAVDDITHQVKLLHNLGAQHIIVINIPNQSFSPLLNQNGHWFTKSFYQYLTSQMNSRLYNQLTPHKLGFYVKIININQILLKIFDSPQHTVQIADKTFRFDNVTEPGCENIATNELAISCIVPPAHEHYLFADKLHPTTYAHQLIAMVINQQILSDSRL